MGGRLFNDKDLGTEKGVAGMGRMVLLMPHPSSLFCSRTGFLAKFSLKANSLMV